MVLLDASARKKQMLLAEGKNATSPFLNSFFGLSVPESTGVSIYTMFFPKKCTFPFSGRDLVMIPTVLGERCRLRSHWILVLPGISSINCLHDTDRTSNLLFRNIGIYNGLKTSGYLSDSNAEMGPPEDSHEQLSDEEISSEPEENAGLNKALDTYRKLIEKNDGEPLTEQQQEDLEKKIKEIESREIVETVSEHEPVEIPCEKNKITIGPPTLTRFEKARIMGARALQLSQGAPPFIPIPKTARISLDISMEELDKKVIPITIRRVLPNGDYQNIPIDYFE